MRVCPLIDAQAFMATRRRAGTRADVATVLFLLFVLGMVVWLFLPRLEKPHPNPQWVACESNLRQLGIGAAMYAIAYKNTYPSFPFTAPVKLETGEVTYAPNRIGMHRERYSTKDDTDLSTTRSLWMLFQQKGLVDRPEVFVCPEIQDTAPSPGEAGKYYDFASYKNVSYGWQVSFGQKGAPSWKVKRPSEAPLAADRGPYGASLEAGLPHPGEPTAPFSRSFADWRPWNSPNHQGLRNHILFLDTHTESSPTPLAGVNGDNIYTRWEDVNAGTGNAQLKRIHGILPTSNETPLAETDTLIYP